MDGCPRKNGAVARREWEKMGATLFKIPPRSTELNPTENLFNYKRRALTNFATE